MLRFRERKSHAPDAKDSKLKYFNSYDVDDSQIATFQGNNCSILTHFFLISSETTEKLPMIPCRCNTINEKNCGSDLVSYKVEIKSRITKPQLIGIVPVWLDSGYSKPRNPLLNET